MKVKRALISVSDKTGLEEFVKGLDKLGVEILSTGGTAKSISKFGIKVTEVSEYTGYPEMMDGRVKTLHPKIHAGLLALRDNEEHMKQLQKAGIPLIDMVVVNLYPFEKTITKPDTTLEMAIENIDIGGPTMMRSAAKNYRNVATVSAPSQYESILNEMIENNGEISSETLAKLGTEVFLVTSKYDSAIANYLTCDESEDFPDYVDIKMKKIRTLRYGENPHQKAAFYRDISSDSFSVADAIKLQGKELSYNNILDLSSALEMVKDYEKPTVSIVKHSNPCGVASADTLKKAYVDALDCDRLSAFGSIMGFNKSIDDDMAKIILEEADFIECIIAPDFSNKATEIFSQKKNLRVIKTPQFNIEMLKAKEIKKIAGGALLQDVDNIETRREDLKFVTESKPTDDLLEALLFGWKVVKYVKSNAIVLCQGTKTVGIGAGQMSRVDSVIISIRKAALRAKGSIMASDAFFPKADSIVEAYKAGVAAIIQPGGSIRDNEVIDACNKYGIPMVLTGKRHFRH